MEVDTLIGVACCVSLFRIARFYAVVHPLCAAVCPVEQSSCLYTVVPAATTSSITPLFNCSTADGGANWCIVRITSCRFSMNPFVARRRSRTVAVRYVLRIHGISRVSRGRGKTYAMRMLSCTTSVRSTRCPFSSRSTRITRRAMSACWADLKGILSVLWESGERYVRGIVASRTYVSCQSLVPSCASCVEC
jgi:hypothetical protein